MAKPDDYVGKTVKVEGLITDVCPKRGCWINVAGDKEFQTIKLKVDDGVIVFPLSAQGEEVDAERIFEKMELSKEEALARGRSTKQKRKRPNFDEKNITGTSDGLPDEGERRRRRVGVSSRRVRS